MPISSMPALSASSMMTHRATFCCPSRSTRVCRGRLRWAWLAAVMTAFLIFTFHPPVSGAGAVRLLYAAPLPLVLPLALGLRQLTSDACDDRFQVSQDFVHAAMRGIDDQGVLGRPER